MAVPRGNGSENNRARGSAYRDAASGLRLEDVADLGEQKTGCNRGGSGHLHFLNVIIAINDTFDADNEGGPGVQR